MVNSLSFDDYHNASPNHLFFIYYLVKGTKKKVLERADQVDQRLKYLAWAGLEVVGIVKKRET
jgi:hypothetical protein